VIRLFVPGDLESGGPIVSSREQGRYLSTVMRLRVGEPLLLFNGRDGEWRARLVEIDRRGCRLETESQVRLQAGGPDLDLLIALVKRTRLETIVEKAAELGARRIAPVITERTNADRTNLARLSAIAIEAAEQTGRLDVPEVLAPAKLQVALAQLSAGRRLMFCDEAGDAPPAIEALAAAGGASWAILIGPEGGFTATERAAIRSHGPATPVSLGPRILRADTAAICAMSLWQAALGDWRDLRSADSTPTSPKP
jgi:16S rRNA (uracil1498-N3)-methyltransferase